MLLTGALSRGLKGFSSLGFPLQALGLGAGGHGRGLGPMKCRNWWFQKPLAPGEGREPAGEAWGEGGISTTV